MTDFKTKARQWPLIETAADLAPLLRGVKKHQWRNYQYSSDPPCPGASDPGSLIFGDDPSGGLAIHCWGCESGCGGLRMLNALEESLTVALQVRYRNGRFRYWINTGRPLTAPVQSDSREKGNPGLNGTPAPEEFRLGQILDMPVWFPCVGKKGWTNSHDGEWVGWRQSKTPEDGGITLARFGGPCWEDWQGVTEKVLVNVKPWRTFPEVLRICEWARKNKKYGGLIRPALAMGGDAETKSPHGLVSLTLTLSPVSTWKGREDGAGMYYGQD